MRILLIFLFGILVTAPIAAQPAVRRDSAVACTCRADLDTLAAKLQRNYVAWPIEYAGSARVEAFARVLKELQQRADSTSDADCIFVLRALTDWFKDGHLFVFELPFVTPERAAELATTVERRSLSEDEVRSDLRRRAGKLDPVEGIWQTRGYRMAVVRDTVRGRQGFVGVVLSSDSALWKAGDVKATFARLPNGAYRTVMRADDHTLRHVDAKIYRRLLLATTPVTWARVYPVEPFEEGTLHVADPLRPTFRLHGADAAVISIPSHDPSYRNVIDSLVRANAEALKSRPYLVVDIRGDLGGGSLTTDPLIPWLVSPTMKPPIGPQGLSMVLASPDNERYFGRGWNPDSVQQRMRAAPGQLMPLLRKEGLGMPFPTDSSRAMPQQVAVVMDRGVASAGEAFVLQVRRSTKVTLYGEPSHGMIDYQSVNVVRLACSARGILFGYPMIAASPTLPKDGLNAKGIQPDVRVPSGTKDWVEWVVGDLRKKARR